MSANGNSNENTNPIEDIDIVEIEQDITNIKEVDDNTIRHLDNLENIGYTDNIDEDYINKLKIRKQNAKKQKRLILILGILLITGLVIISGLVFVLLKNNKVETVEQEPEVESEETKKQVVVKEDGTVVEKSTEGELDSEEYVAGIVCFGDGPTVGGDNDEGYTASLRTIFEENNIPVPVFSQGESEHTIESLEAFISDLKLYPNCIPVFYLEYGGAEESTWEDFLFRLSDLANYSQEFPERFIVIGTLEGDIAINICYDYAYYSEFGDRYLNFRDYLSAKGPGMEVFSDDESRAALNFRAVPDSIRDDNGELTDDGYYLLAEAIYYKLDNLGYLYKNDRNKSVDRADAFQFVKTIGPGISLSGMYDEIIPVQKFETPYDIQIAPESFQSIPAHMTVSDGSQVWQNEITEEMLDLIDNAGFRTIRIPVGFYSYRDESGKLNESFLEELTYITEYYLNLDEDNKVIISGINDSWNYLYYDNYYRAGALSYSLWREISDAFEDFDDRVIFEGFHRLSLEGTVFENSEGIESAISVINSVQENFVKAVRNSGGNNETRFLILNGYGLGAMSGCFEGLRIPLDEHLLLGATGFMDYKFTTNPNAGFDDSRKYSWDLGLNSLIETAEEYNLPLIMTEIGSVNKESEARLEYAKYAAATLREKDVPYLWFDNGIIGNDDYSYGLIDRENYEFVYPQTVVALLY